MTKDKTTWYASWFDTPFYHILYKDRNHEEAEAFMSNLTSYLNIPEGGKILDLACGKGRHSVFLNSIGYDVTGVDLSKNSIDFAKQFENDTLHFDVHDMTTPYPKTFDAVFNLFTSFGYFDNEESNLNTIRSIKAELNEFGFGVIDFMNAEFVINNLISENTKTVEGITFYLKRKLENSFIVKDISFETNGEKFKYQERVRAFTLNNFEALFEKAGVTLLEVFGNYKLHKFDAKTSERLIMVFK
jgi:SAM-dependent methyltransferase